MRSHLLLVLLLLAPAAAMEFQQDVEYVALDNDGQEDESQLPTLITGAFEGVIDNRRAASMYGNVEDFRVLGVTQACRSDADRDDPSGCIFGNLRIVATNDAAVVVYHPDQAKKTVSADHVLGVPAQLVFDGEKDISIADGYGILASYYNGEAVYDSIQTVPAWNPNSDPEEDAGYVSLESPGGRLDLYRDGNLVESIVEPGVGFLFTGPASIPEFEFSFGFVDIDGATTAEFSHADEDDVRRHLAGLETIKFGGEEIEIPSEISDLPIPVLDGTLIRIATEEPSLEDIQYVRFDTLSVSHGTTGMAVEGDARFALSDGEVLGAQGSAILITAIVLWVLALLTLFLRFIPGYDSAKTPWWERLAFVGLLLIMFIPFNLAFKHLLGFGAFDDFIVESIPVGLIIVSAVYVALGFLIITPARLVVRAILGFVPIKWVRGVSVLPVALLVLFGAFWVLGILDAGLVISRRMG